MIKVVTLASCSHGNSVLIMGEKTNILIDAGINITDLVKKFRLLNVEPESISAVLSTHEHTDHIKGLGPLMRKYGTTLYVHADGVEAVLKKIGKVDKTKVIEFFNMEFYVGEFKVVPFKVPHDSISCVGFRIESGNNRVAYATDLGVASEEIVNELKNCKLVILESNHDEKMLYANPNYSDSLKRRILSKHGHLSNVASAKVVCQLAVSNVKQVVLAHLSLENNDPQLAYETHCSYLEAQGIKPNVNIKIDIAPPFTFGTVFVLK